MKSKNQILLGTLLKSTSIINILKYSKDAKKRKRIIGGIVGMAVLYAMLVGYCIAMCIGYGMVGMETAIPAICVLSVSALAFIFTILKSNGYLFNFKEYDMLMSLPYEAKTVASCKFMYMYIKSIPWYMSISFAMMVGYGWFARPAFYIYLLWFILALFLPVIPMLIASFIGFLIARISANFKKTNLLQTILTFIFVLFCFSIRYIIEAIFKNEKQEVVMENLSAATDKAGQYYFPLKWFEAAINEADIVAFLLFIVVTVVLFEVIFIFVGKSYRKINSALKSHATEKRFKMTHQKKRNLYNAIAFKEFKRMLGSTVYMTNVGIGEILTIIMGIVSLVVGMDKVIAVVTQGAPVSTTMLFPAIPLIVYFLIGMVPTTVCSPSLEGKNYWIVQSLPIKKSTLYKGKMLFNMYFTVPFMFFGIIALCISAKVPLISVLLYLVEGFVLCAFSTTWGCVCGIKHMRLDWENEVEVIKQGAAVAIYLFPNMFVTMGLIVLVVFLGLHMESNLVSLIIILVATILALLCYRRVNREDKGNY